MSISRDRCLLGIVQLLKFSGFSLYLLSFFLYSPFNVKSLQIGYLDQEFKIYDIPNRPHTSKLQLQNDKQYFELTEKQKTTIPPMFVC